MDPSPAPVAQPLPPPRFISQWRFWLGAGLVFLLLVYLLRGILLPFVAGAAVAYLLDPLARSLEQRGLSRTVATVLITALFVLVLAGALALLVPALHAQISRFITNLPGYAATLDERLRPLIDQARLLLPEDQIASLRESALAYTGEAARWALTALGKAASGGMALVNLLSLFVLTPVVAFYLLRDWGTMITTLDTALPRRHAAVIRQQVRAIDETLAGFLRGQGMVCLALGSFYAVGLSLAGLDLGLVVGLGAGLISFIPYVGTIIGGAVSIGLALAQFSEVSPVVVVAAIFIAGQVLEGYALSPWLVGSKVGLHPVWMIFALLAGGSLLGFLGILIAIPVAAILGVLIRFGLSRYLDSPYYTGDPDSPPCPDDPTQP